MTPYLRILFSVVILGIVPRASGQETSFDQRVEQLFFGVDVSKPSAKLVDKFSSVKELTYRKPKGYISYALTGNVWTHQFRFTSQPYFANHIDTGIIEFKIVENGRRKVVTDLFLKLQFDKKEDAIKVCEELKGFFMKTNAINRITSDSDGALSTAEFTDKTAKKYPYVMFMLFDKTDIDKKYQIIFSTDNDMHYEK